MRQPKKLSSAALSALLFTTWTFGAAAQTNPTSTSTTSTTSTTPAPATTTTTTTMVDPSERESETSTMAPVVANPLVGVETEQSSLPNTPLLVTGTLVLGATYGASALAAGMSDRESNDKLYYPVAGPWLALDDRDCDLVPCDNKTLDTTLLIGSGILQGVGALGMVMSLFIPQTTTKDWYLIGNRDFVVAPVAGTGTVGATAVGRF